MEPYAKARLLTEAKDRHGLRRRHLRESPRVITQAQLIVAGQNLTITESVGVGRNSWPSEAPGVVLVPAPRPAPIIQQ